MIDKRLLKFATSFRQGMLGKRDSTGMCFAVCAPLQALLELHGIECQLRETRDLPTGEMLNHYWIRIADGRVLDPTADQFAELDLPKIYLGPPIPEIHYG